MPDRLARYSVHTHQTIKSSTTVSTRIKIRIKHPSRGKEAFWQIREDGRRYGDTERKTSFIKEAGTHHGQMNEPGSKEGSSANTIHVWNRAKSDSFPEMHLANVGRRQSARAGMHRQ